MLGRDFAPSPVELARARKTKADRFWQFDESPAAALFDGAFNAPMLWNSNFFMTIEDWFDQVTGEVRRVRYVRNRPVIEFVPKRRGQRTEALDALCYAWGVRQSPAVKAIDLRARAARRPQPAVGQPPPRRPTIAASQAASMNKPKAL